METCLAETGIGFYAIFGVALMGVALAIGILNYRRHRRLRTMGYGAVVLTLVFASAPLPAYATTSCDTQAVVAVDSPQACSESDSQTTQLERKTVVADSSVQLASSVPKRRITAVSPNGQRIALGVSYSGNETWRYVMISSDSALTWNKVAAPVNYETPHQLSISDDGRYIAGVVRDQTSGEYRYVGSADGGVSWQVRAVLQGSGDVNVGSRDGMSFVQYDESSRMLSMTANRGVTWSAATIPAQLSHGGDLLSISNDGSTVLMSGYDGAADSYLFISANGGASWSATPVGVLDMSSLSTAHVTSDGSRIILTGLGTSGTEHTAQVSTNFGASWYRPSVDFGGNFIRAVVSNDGSVRLIYSDYNPALDSSEEFISDSGDWVSWGVWSPVAAGFSVIDSSVSADAVTYFLERAGSGYIANGNVTNFAARTVFARHFRPADIDLDVDAPGQQLMLDRGDTLGWYAKYTIETDELIFRIVDDSLFDRSTLPIITYEAVDPSCSYARVRGAVDVHLTGGQ